MEKIQPTISPGTHSIFGMVHHQYASESPFLNSAQQTVDVSTIQGCDISPRPPLQSIDDLSNCSTESRYYTILEAINAALLICEEDDFNDIDVDVDVDLIRVEVSHFEPGQ